MGERVWCALTPTPKKLLIKSLGSGGAIANTRSPPIGRVDQDVCVDYFYGNLDLNSDSDKEMSRQKE